MVPDRGWGHCAGVRDPPDCELFSISGAIRRWWSGGDRKDAALSYLAPVDPAATTAGTLRSATRPAHERLERAVDAVERLADPCRRPALLRGYAAFYLPAEAALSPLLAGLPNLSFDGQRRAALLGRHLEPHPPAFPLPGSRAEALGLLYVLEGSSLGGRVLLRALVARGVDVSELGFLDPYGAETGPLWRGFLAVLERETRDETRRAEAVRGALRGFDHAARLLCEVRP